MEENKKPIGKDIASQLAKGLLSNYMNREDKNENDLSVKLWGEIGKNYELLKDLEMPYKDWFSLMRIRNLITANELGLYFLYNTKNNFVVDTPFCDQIADCKHIDEVLKISYEKKEGYFGPLISGCGCCDPFNYESEEDIKKYGYCSESLSIISQTLAKIQYNIDPKDYRDDGQGNLLPIKNLIEINKYLNLLIKKYL